MNRQALLVVSVFVVALGSGMLLGMGVARTPRGDRGGWIETELKLTADQREQMRKIWQDVVRSAGQKAWDARRELSKQREDAIVALLTPEQKKQYDAIQDKFNADMKAANDQRDAAFRDAVAKTKQMLTPAQAAQYDEILAKGFHGPGHGGPGGPGGPRHDGGPGGPWHNDGAASRPGAMRAPADGAAGHQP